MHASLAVTLASRLPDVDVDPLTLVHDPARLFSRLFFGSFSRKNDGETGMRTFDPWRRVDKLTDLSVTPRCPINSDVMKLIQVMLKQRFNTSLVRVMNISLVKSKQNLKFTINSKSILYWHIIWSLKAQHKAAECPNVVLAYTSSSRAFFHSVKNLSQTQKIAYGRAQKRSGD